jgi:uncharacterized protein
MNVIPFEQPGIRGFLHRAEPAGERGLVLTHGAGGNCRSQLLVSAAEAFSAEGVSVLRCDLPFRQRRATGPPSPSTAAADREGLRRAIEAMRGIVPGQIFLGGQSYGGRQATMLAADEPEIAAALLLFSYPLHPPGKPDRLRTEHFPRLRVPAVFIQGSNDPFGSPAELRSAVSLISTPTEIIQIMGAAHDLKRGRFEFGPVVAALLALGVR